MMDLTGAPFLYEEYLDRIAKSQNIRCRCDFEGYQKNIIPGGRDASEGFLGTSELAIDGLIKGSE